MTSGGGTGGSVDVVYIDLQGRLEQFEQRLNEAEQMAGESGERSGSKFGSALTLGLGVATAGALALAGGLAAIATTSFNLANEAAQNVDEFQSKLGASREEAERLGTVAEQVFGDNWTGSLTEAGAAVANVRREVKGLTDEELRSVTGASVAIAETFEEDQSKVAAAVQSLMKSTGISAQEATDFITKGFQKGLNTSGDFLDSINEYSPQFEKSKIGAGELFSLFETGAAKGALGTDKVVDAFKEFGLTLIDVNDGSKDVYKELGLNQQKLVDDVNSGALTQAKAFELVTNKLKDVKGTADRTRISAAIFGGAGEDFGNGLAQLDLTKTKLKDLSGATDSLNQRYTSFGDFFGGVSRKLQVSLLPLGKELLSLANDAMPYLQKAADWLGSKLPGWISSAVTGFKTFATGAVTAYNTVSNAYVQVSAQAERFTGFLKRNQEVLIPLAAGIGTVVAALAIHRVVTIAATAVTTAWSVATTAATAASVALRAAIAFITGPVGLAIAAITLLVAAGVYLYRNWDEVKAKALAIWGQIKEIVSNAVTGAVNFLKNIDLKEVAVQMLLGYVNGIRAASGLVINAVKNLGSTVLNGIRAVLKIQSPSKEMYILGEHTVEGFAEGITKTTPLAQQAAAGLSSSVVSEVEKARQQLEQGISMEKWVEGLRSATQAQLEHAQALARSQGDAERYNAIKTELARRQDVATAATQKATDAVKQQAQQLSDNRAQIAAGEAQERYTAGLRTATSAQLSSALQTAKTAGEVEKYNLIKAEQQRREDASTAASDRATAAAKEAADQLTANRKAITDGLAFGVYVDGLRDYTDELLVAARNNALAAGDSEKFNAVLAEQKSRADEAAQSISDLVDAQIAGANARFTDTQGAADNAFRQAFGADDVGLIKALAATTGLSVDRIRRDVQGALNDAKRFAPDAAAVIERVWADALTQRQKAAQAEQDSYAATVQFAIDTIGKLSDTGLMELYTKAQATRDSTLMAAVLKEGERRALDFQAQLDAGIQASDKALSELGSLKPSGQDLAAQVGITPDTVGTFTDLLDRMGELRGDLAEPGVAEAWAQSIEELGKRGELTSAQVAALKDQLKDLQTLTSGPLLPDNLAGRGIADGTPVGADDPATGALSGAEKDILLKVAIESDPDELRAALDGMEQAGKGATDLAEVYREALAQINGSNAEALASITAGVDDAGNVLYQTEDQLRGIGVVSENSAPAVFDLANAIANLNQFESVDTLQALIDTAGLAEEDAQALREAWQSQNAALFDLVTGYDEAGNAIYATDEQLRGIGVTTGETTDAFFDMGNAVKNVGDFTREELESLITTAQLTADQAKVLRDAWGEVQLNVTVNIGGMETGLKQLDLYKSAITGVADVVSGVFEDMVSGTEVGVQSILVNMAKMALGIVKQVAIAIIAYQAQALAVALVSTTTLNIPMAIASIAAAAAIAGIAAGLENRLEQQINATTAPTSGGSSTSSSVAQQVAKDTNNNVNIPSSQVTLIAGPESVTILATAASDFRTGVSEFREVFQKGVKVNVETNQAADSDFAWDLGTGRL